jgi:predicted secreted protein
MVVPIDIGLATSDSQSTHGTSISVGDSLQVRLEIDTTSDYVWTVTRMPDRTVLRSTGESQIDPPSPVPDVTSKQLFTFTAVGKGWAVITLAYASPSGGKPKREVKLRVQVY